MDLGSLILNFVIVIRPTEVTIVSLWHNANVGMDVCKISYESDRE